MEKMTALLYFLAKAPGKGFMVLRKEEFPTGGEAVVPLASESAQKDCPTQAKQHNSRREKLLDFWYR